MYNAERRGKIPTLPLTEDLQKLRRHLVDNIEGLTQRLAEETVSDIWLKLAKYTMARLIVFNKRRRAEVSELKVQQFLNRPPWHSEIHGEMKQSMSQTDQLLASR